MVMVSHAKEIPNRRCRCPASRYGGGIEREAVFRTDADIDHLSERLGEIL
jgi:hypothetical protein